MNGAKSQIATFVPAFPDTGPAAESFRPKILLYSHDTFGLGNIHRTLLLSDALRRAFPAAAVLIITGSPVIHALRIPEAIDYLKLPCLDRVAADRYEPRFLSTFAKEVKRMRRAVIPRAALGFGPRMMIVHKRPLGGDGGLGGGGDGSDVVDAYLEGLLGLPRRLMLQTTIVFGPQMPERRRRATLERFGHLPDVAFFDFEPDLVRRYAEADVVVSMAGYSTVCELLSWRRRAVLVPRAAPVREQLIRARRFAELGYFDIVEPGELEPNLLIGKVRAALGREPTPTLAVDLNGLPRIVERVQAMLG